MWAPSAGAVSARVDGTTTELSSQPGGWWAAQVPGAAHGSDYGFLLDGEDSPLPDPRTRWQPDGPLGFSRVYDHSRFAWTDAAWRGVAPQGSVIYELHVGTFTADRTLDAAIERLDHLVSLGVDLVELMPVATFPGRHGWGYDVVHPYAVHEPYGGPDAMKRLVDACHARGLGVCLDVVYNHLGPSGNYLPRFGPYFSDKHETPWGSGVNLDDEGAPEVRRWIIDNALSWLRDFHVDALRLDAVHALADDSPVHLLAELSREVDALSCAVRRPLTLIAESDLNDASMVTPVEGGGLGMTAQWSDDFHHALHALLTGESQGYYGDFAAEPYTALARTLTGAFFHAGTHSSFRGEDWGTPVDTARIPGWRFVGYTQTHDQVGNRAVGDRLSATLSPGLAKVGAALMLTSPFTPMLFMGEEWAASTPWQFFTSHEAPDLAEAVRAGRRREFAPHGWAADDVPDPQAASTVAYSTLDWTETVSGAHAEMLAFYRRLIALRRAEASLSDPRLDRVRVAYDAEAQWVVVTRGDLRVACNLGASAASVPLDGEVTELLLGEPGDGSCSLTQSYPAAGLTLPAESVAVVRVAVVRVAAVDAASTR